MVKGADAARVIADRDRALRHRAFRRKLRRGARVQPRAAGGAWPRPRAADRRDPVRGLGRGRPRIVGYDAKWTSDSEAYVGTPRRFGLENDEPALAAELVKLAKSCWDLFGLAGYARVDFRVDREGKPTILEVNVNPCLNPDAGFAAAAAQARALLPRPHRQHYRCRAASLASHRLTCFASSHVAHPQSGRRHDGAEPRRDRGGAEDHARAVPGDAGLRHRQAPRAARQSAQAPLRLAPVRRRECPRPDPWPGASAARAGHRLLLS